MTTSSPSERCAGDGETIRGKEVWTFSSSSSRPDYFTNPRHSSKTMTGFKDKYGPWALITGASSGIGAEFARQLAAKGLNLVLVARREERLRALARELETAHPIAVTIIPVDLTTTDFLAVIQQATDGLEIGLLVNNAGVMPTGRFLDHDLEQELRQLNLNTRAPLILTHHFGRPMAERGRGGLLFLASMTAFQGTPSASL